MRLWADYEDASYEDCMEDLHTTVNALENYECYDYKTLEELGMTIQNIAERLQKLEEEE